MKRKYFKYLRIGLWDEFVVVGGFGFLRGGLKLKFCWCDSLTFSVILCAQHDPNINESTHIPICWPSDFMHSHTNIHVPPYPLAVHGFGLIFKVLLLFGIELTSSHNRSIWSDEINHLLHIVDLKFFCKVSNLLIVVAHNIRIT